MALGGKQTRLGGELPAQPSIRRVILGEFAGSFEVVYRDEIHARFSAAEHDNAVDFSNGFVAGLREGRKVWT